MANVSSKHPLYESIRTVWDKMYDAEKQSRIKEKGLLYLPATESMKIDGMQEGDVGLKCYQSYKLRAVFPTEYADSLDFDLGMMHQKPAIIVVPDKLKPMLENATNNGESMLSLLTTINRFQLQYGRVGMLADFPMKGNINTLPYIVIYDPRSIINWDDGVSELGNANLNLVVLDETYQKRVDDFNWVEQVRYRVLKLGDLLKNEQDGKGDVYSYAVVESDVADELEYKNPTYAGKVFNKIPFVFANVTHINSTIESPPKEDLVDASIACYQLEADYREVLHLQGKDTLLLKGVTGASNKDGDDSVRVGARSAIRVTADGDAKYIGISGDSLGELRKAVENDKENLSIKSGQKINTSQSSQESGEAIRTRVAARTANLISISKTGAAALEKLLKLICEWMGLDPNEVSVTPNLEFTRTAFNVQYLVQLMVAKTQGAPISMQTIHEYIKDAGLTVMDFTEEVALCQSDLVDYKDLLTVVTEANKDLNAEQNVIKQ
ncbi:hypothetical protein [Providencia phage PSTCR7]|uniref:DUF4055 domain-containing protein n=1 Tax=Providencia phage PSTCR7 TaxID=2783549 RepID=A0A7S9SWK5_9CAUD|nr:portal protein [Providencia phage PSTCR7]QPI18518.1 hypothetical protein [Providencia phage PSTCR7]